MIHVRFIATILIALAPYQIKAASPSPKPPGANVEGQFAFTDVIRETTGHEVIPFDQSNPAQQNLLARLQVVAAKAAQSTKEEKITSRRANEVGNAMETRVLAALQAAGFTAHRPRTKSGHMQSSGYPDIAIESEPFCYLELKTFSPKTENSSQRTFYYSPSVDPKVTHDALHLLLAFEMEQVRDGNEITWVPIHYKIVSLHKLPVRLKVEYNQSNRGLYAPKQILAEDNVN